LASIPLRPEDVLRFKKSDADPKSVKVNLRFLERENVTLGEASRLVVQAYDFAPKKEEGTKSVRTYEHLDVEGVIPEAFFPPCIMLIKKGLKDGRKRSVFILRNFLASLNWEKKAIEENIYTWNKNNQEPLREVAIKGQLRYVQKVLPPNCANAGYYKDFGVCQPDSFCSRIKNPAQYAKLKARLQANMKRGRRKKEIPPKKGEAGGTVE
jgi:DNA primase large subunit